MSKGNEKIGKPVSKQDMDRRVEAARESYNRHKDAAAEAVGHVYLLYRETRSGEPRKWLEEEIKELNRDIEKHNTKLQNEYELAKSWKDKKLPKDHSLLQPTDDADQIAKNEKEIADFELLLNMSQPERSKLRRVPLMRREDSSKYMEIVRYVLNFDRSYHTGMVSRYCSVIEWIASKFDADPNVDITVIKTAVEEAGGFDRCVDLQRLVEQGLEINESDEDIIRKAQATEARGVVLGMKATASLSMTAKKTDGNFVLLVCRPSADGLDVLGEADLSDNDVQRAVLRLGEANMLGADASLEFVARVLEIGATIREKQEVPSDEDPDKKVATERLVSLRADANGKPELVVSVNKADSGPILHARPHDLELLTLIKGECVLQGSARRRMEKEITSKSRRRLLTIKVNTEPKKATGQAAISPLSWEFHNRALAEKGKSTANQTFFWTALNSIPSKPLDVDNFNPSFRGTLEQSDISSIKTHLLDVWTESTAADKNKRNFLLQLKDKQLTLKCGDAEAVDLKLNTDSTASVNMKFKIPDIVALVDLIAAQHSTYEIAGDPGGLIRISWSDSFASYDYYLPTIGVDGRYINRRVAPMSDNQLPMAAE